MPRRDEDGMRAQPLGPADRHRGPDTEVAGYVVRREDDAPAAGMTDDDRLCGDLRAVPDLDARVKGVHVDVQDMTAGIVRGACLVHHLARLWLGFPALAPSLPLTVAPG